MARAAIDIALPSGDMPAILAWLDEHHRVLSGGLAALVDDADLETERPSPWERVLPRRAIIAITINHDLYHSGGINRQLALIRGAEGWDRDTQ